MAKQINYTKKNHVTCQIYTLLYVAVFFLPTARIVEIEFWITYTLLTPFALHQLIEAGSFLFPPSSVSSAQNLINCLFMTSMLFLHLHFTFTLVRTNATHEIQKRVPSNLHWVVVVVVMVAVMVAVREGQKYRKGEWEKSEASTTLSVQEQKNKQKNPMRWA